MNDTFLLQSLINQKSSLYELSIKTNVNGFIEHVHCRRFNPIRVLRVDSCLMGVDDFKIEDLCLVFPYLEHLHVNRLYSIERIF